MVHIMRIECDSCILRNWNSSDVESLVENANNYRIATNIEINFPIPIPLKMVNPG